LIFSRIVEGISADFLGTGTILQEGIAVNFYRNAFL